MANRKREVYKHKRKIIRWIAINEFNIEGHMKSIGYRLLGFSEELLETGISLLSHYEKVPCRLPGLKPSCGIYTIPEMHLRFSTDFLFYRL